MEREKENKEIDPGEIVNIARQAAKEYNFFTRNDLAWQLGVPDDVNLMRGIFKAYEQTKDPSLRKLAANDGEANLMETATPMMLAESGDLAKLGEEAAHGSQLVKGGVDAASKSFSKVQGILENGVAGSSGLGDFLMGQGRAVDIQNEAAQLQDGFRGLVADYTSLVDQIRSLSGDFVLLRGQVEVTYRKFAAILIDVYGDRVRQIEPALFDFDAIEYLDTDQMLQEVLAGLDNIVSSGGAAIQAIGDSFRNTANTALNRMAKSKDTGTAIGMGLFDAFDHYSKAATVTNELERDYSRLREKVCKRVGDIGSDAMRIEQMRATLDSVFIPHALLLCRYADRLMDKEFARLLDTMYGQPAAAKLREDRDELLRSYLSLQYSIADHIVNADLCRRDGASILPVVDELQARLDADNEKWTGGDSEYNANYAKTLKKRATKLYKAKAQMEIRLNAGAEHDQMATQDLKRLDDVRAKLAANSSQMSGKATLSDADYAAMGRHLADILRLLKQAKDILQSGFGEDMLHPALLTEAVTLPELSGEMQAKIHGFITKKVDSLKTQPPTEMIEGPDGQPEPRELTPEEQSDAEMDARMNEALDSAAALIHSSVMLGYQLAKEQVTISDYKRQMAANRALFEKAMGSVNDRAALIGAVARKAAESDDDKTVKDALLLLTDIDPETVSDEKMTDFVKGNGTITI